jgi:integrase
VAVNAAASTERIPQKRGEVQHWTEAQAKKFLRSIKGHRLEALFVLALSTGMREGELFALHWDQVDLKRRTIRVTHSQEDVNGHLVRGDVKTTKGRRLITLDPATAAILKGLPRTGDAVFCAAEGGPLRKSNFIRREWAPAVKAAGLPPMRFHGLRHTHATLLLAMGVHPKVVSERLGHASIALTLDTYSHAVPSMQAEAAAKMGRLLTAK